MAVRMSPEKGGEKQSTREKKKMLETPAIKTRYIKRGKVWKRTREKMARPRWGAARHHNANSKDEASSKKRGKGNQRSALFKGKKKGQKKR